MCWKCGKTISDEEPIPRNAECSFCHTELHSCRNCQFYAPGSHFDCHETVDELVVEKERSNFCEAFKVRRTFDGSDKGNDDGNKAAAAKKAFDALFGN